MAMSDPVADMLTRIRNAGNAGHVKVDIPKSKFKVEIAKILENNGYIRSYELVKENTKFFLRIYFKRNKIGRCAIVKIDRISKPGRRVYCRAKDVLTIYNGLGISILSTSQGLMSDKDAREKNLGGEIVCTVW